jgi:hypothetical protein
MAKWIKWVIRAAASLPVIIIGAGTAQASVPKGPDVLPDQFSSRSAGEQELAALLISPEQQPVVVHVASRFKEAGDKGRPDLFGLPGEPVIGPPGKSGY